MRQSRENNKKRSVSSSKKCRVFIEKFSGYDDQRILEFVRTAMDSSGLDFREKRILLKPNLLLAKKPEAAVTTHPVVIEAVVKVLQEKKAKIFIGDSSGMPVPMTSIASVAGVMSIVKKYGIEFVDFKKDPVELTCKDNRLVKKFTLARIVNEVDIIINLPKLKTHVQSIYSGALKNMFGCIPGLLKPQFHFKFPEADRFARMIVDLHHIVTPSLNIMDGIQAMHGEGPSHGEPFPLGLLMVSTDAVALDSVACRIIGLNPAEVPIIRIANEDRLGEIDQSKIRLVGIDDISSVKALGFKLMRNNSAMRMGPSMIQGVIRQIGMSRPEIAKSKCLHCFICVSVCPADALHKKRLGKAPIFNYKKCIRCYCCHEMCPEGAIDKRSTFLSPIFEKLKI